MWPHIGTTSEDRYLEEAESPADIERKYMLLRVIVHQAGKGERWLIVDYLKVSSPCISLFEQMLQRRGDNAHQADAAEQPGRAALQQPTKYPESSDRTSHQPRIKSVFAVVRVLAPCTCGESVECVHVQELG